MIHNLYIISEGGIALYSKSFVKSELDEQLISGFLLAVGNFAKETVGSGLKKIEMETGEQLHVYYNPSLKLTAAAIAAAEDYPGLISKILQEILNLFYSTFKKDIKSIHLVEQTPNFDPIVMNLLERNTAKRDKKRFILGLILGAVLLGCFFPIFRPLLLSATINFYNSIHALMNPLGTIHVFGIYSLTLEVFLILSFIPSSFLTGYIVGSRKKGKWIGIVFFFFMLGLSIIFLLIPSQRQIGALYSFILIIYIPLVLVTSIVLGYLGGLLRDRRKLYSIPLEWQI
ncbi:MAG: hypothetical protein ACTSQI_05875 [Candidatus Helarchaeota archaeon]